MKSLIILSCVGLLNVEEEGQAEGGGGRGL
jgi:hypothetical protein